MMRTTRTNDRVGVINIFHIQFVISSIEHPRKDNPELSTIQARDQVKK